MKNIVPHIDGRGCRIVRKDCPNRADRKDANAERDGGPHRRRNIRERRARAPPLGARALTVAQYVANAPAIRVTARIMQLLAET